jgi:hypothetical protein
MQAKVVFPLNHEPRHDGVCGECVLLEVTRSLGTSMEISQLRVLVDLTPDERQ